MDPNTAWFGVAGGLAAVAFAVVLIFLVLNKPTGNDRMREIAAAIQEGAAAYLNRQYTSRSSSGSLSTGGRRPSTSSARCCPLPPATSG